MVAAFGATGPGGFEVEYIVSGDTYTRKTYFKNELRKEVSGKFGEEVDAETFDGRNSKVLKYKINSEGNVWPQSRIEWAWL